MYSLRYVHFWAFSSNSDNIFWFDGDVSKKIQNEKCQKCSKNNFICVLKNIIADPQNIVRIIRNSPEMNVSQRVDVARYPIFFLAPKILRAMSILILCTDFSNESKSEVESSI